MPEYDKVPVAVGALVATVVPVVPGPSKSEWSIALVGLVSLAVRELVWWIRNRRKG